MPETRHLTRRHGNNETGTWYAIKSVPRNLQACRWQAASLEELEHHRPDCCALPTLSGARRIRDDLESGSPADRRRLGHGHRARVAQDGPTDRRWRPVAVLGSSPAVTWHGHAGTGPRLGQRRYRADRRRDRGQSLPVTRSNVLRRSYWHGDTSATARRFLASRRRYKGTIR